MQTAGSIIINRLVRMLRDAVGDSAWTRDVGVITQMIHAMLQKTSMGKTAHGNCFLNLKAGVSAHCQIVLFIAMIILQAVLTAMSIVTAQMGACGEMATATKTDAGNILIRPRATLLLE